MDYRALVAAVLEENRQVLDAVNTQELDIVVMLLIERKGVSLQSMQESHTNLEGLPYSFA
jgi:hypothetical protein